MTDPPVSLKDRVLLAVQDRVSRDGFARLSVDELTRSIGMSKKTFYKVFESKEDMISQLVDRMMGELGGAIDKITTADVNFVDKLHDVLAFFGTVPDKVESVLAKDIHLRMPHLWKRIEEFRQKKIQENFSRIITQGIHEGFIHKDLNQRIFLLVYIGAIQAVVRPEILADESFSAKQAIQQIVRMFFVGIMTDEGRRIFEQQKNRSPIE